jgi:hypothetical protein
MFRQFRTWLKKRRRRRLEREARELDALVSRAHRYAHNPFIASVLSCRRRKGYITPRQQRWLRVAVHREYLTSHGA